MIEIKVTYSRKTYKSGRELFIYKDISVRGHSSDGTINSTKCCAGVTAVTCGLLNLLNGDTRFCVVEVSKGYFHYHMNNYYEEYNSAINAMVYQLDFIEMSYPNFFDVQYIEENNNDEQK